MNTSEFRHLLTEVARKNLDSLHQVSEEVAFAAGGVNGPYFDLETPVRNSAHWCITYSILAKFHADETFEKAANCLANFLVAPSNYCLDGIYVHRQKHGKDWSNGVIGQGWVIEALAIAARALGREELHGYAMKAASRYPFDRKNRAWKRVDARTGHAAIDYTLNHQLWYAAALAELNDPNYDAEIRSFLDLLLSGGIRFGREGRILHLLYANSLKGQLLRFRYSLNRARGGQALKEKEIGYHLYNLHPLARLQQRFSRHDIFQSGILAPAIDYAKSPRFSEALIDNKYSYAYNAPGFEFPIVQERFFPEFCLERVFQHQCDKTLINAEAIQAFYGNCPDPLTLNARIYESLFGSAYESILAAENASVA